MKKYIEPIVRSINTIDRRVLIFFLLALSFLSFSLHPNEETKFGIAKYLMDENWMKHSFSFNQEDPTKFLFNIIAGFLLNYLTFEQLAFWGRLFSYVLFAIILSKIFAYAKLENLSLSLILLFYFDHQSIIGGGAIFKAFEPKTFAYIFILAGLDKLFRKRILITAVMLAIATLFHLLAGAWMILAAGLFMIIEKYKFKELLRTAVLYFLIAGPLLFIILKTYGECPSQVNGVNTDWIYVYFRNPHHIGFFKNFDYFINRHAGLILINLIFFLISAFIYTRHPNNRLKEMNRFILVLFSLQFISLVIGLFDVNGVFLKSYPYRSNTISTLFFFICTVLYLKDLRWELFPEGWPARIGKSAGSYTTLAGLLAVFILFSHNSFHTVRGIVKDFKTDSNREFYSCVKEISDPGDIFLISLNCETDYLDFIRKTERDRFVVFKFVPSSHCQIYEWYTRYRLKERASIDPSLLPQLKSIYSVDYFVSCEPLETSFLKFIVNVEGKNVYRIE
jgi:hypothetical protein